MPPVDLTLRREKEREKIKHQLSSAHEARFESIEGGEGRVAFVDRDGCIGCDQCSIVCDDKAIEMYDAPLASPILETKSNRKAKIIRDACTGCRLCILACPTDAITMIDR